MFHKNLKSLRSHLSLTQEEFSAKIGIHRVTLAKLEKGIFKPEFSTLEKICDVFKVNIGWLVSGQGEPFTNKPQTLLPSIEKKEILEIVEAVKADKKLLDAVLGIIRLKTDRG